MIKFNYLYFVLPVVSGIMLIFGYPPYGINFLLWFALIPLLVFISLNSSKNRAFSGGYLTGLIFFGATTSYFLFASMADWAGADGKIITMFILSLAWLIYVLFSSFFFAGGIYVFSRLKTGQWPDIFLFSSLWIIFEYLRAWAFTVFNWGPGSLWGAHFTLGHLGYGLGSSSFNLIAGIAGIYGLSFFLALINYLVFFLFEKLLFQKKAVYGLSFLFLTIFLLLAPYILSEIKNLKSPSFKKTIPITLVQTNFPSLFNYTQKQEKEFSEVQLGLFKEALEEKEWPRIIVFPEHANFLPRLNRFYPGLFSSESAENRPEALVIDSGWHLDRRTSETSTRLVYFDLKEQKIIAAYDKTLLMPVGDYLPYFMTAVFKLAGREDWLVDLERTRGYEKGEELTIAEYAGVKIAGLMCSEIASPYLYREFARQGAEFFVSPASDAIFKGNKFILGQILSMARVRAAETGRYFVQAANQGDSFVVDQTGKLMVKNEKIGNEVINAEVKIFSHRTFYNRFGDWILALSALIIGIFAARSGFRFRR